jgi:hypothetical protein
MSVCHLFPVKQPQASYSLKSDFMSILTIGSFWSSGYFIWVLSSWRLVNLLRHVFHF